MAEIEDEHGYIGWSGHVGSAGAATCGLWSSLLAEMNRDQLDVDELPEAS
jgi:hypothetical protein